MSKPLFSTVQKFQDYALKRFFSFVEYGFKSSFFLQQRKSSFGSVVSYGFSTSFLHLSSWNQLTFSKFVQNPKAGHGPGWRRADLGTNVLNKVLSGYVSDMIFYTALVTQLLQDRVPIRVSQTFPFTGEDSSCRTKSVRE